MSRAEDQPDQQAECRSPGRRRSRRTATKRASTARACQRGTNGGRTRCPSKPVDPLRSTFELHVDRSDDARTHAQLSAIRALLSSGSVSQKALRAPEQSNTQGLRR
jgi:hypothetical protein